MPEDAEQQQRTRWYEERFSEFYDSVPGSPLERGCAALALVECVQAEEALQAAAAELTAEQQPTLRAAFHCYLAYLVRRGLRAAGASDSVDQVLETLAIQLGARSTVRPSDFRVLWDAVLGLEDQLRGGQQTGILLPWVYVVTHVNIAKVPLSHVLDIQWGTYCAVLYKTVPETIVGFVLRSEKNRAPE